MLRFLDNYLYILTLVIILMAAFWVSFSSKNIYTKIKQNQKVLSYSLALVQIVITVSFYIFNLIIKGYHHLLATDLCPFLAIISIPLFLMQKQNLLKMIMPYMILGATLNMVASSPGFIAEGSFPGAISYLRHLVLMIQGLFLFVFLDKYSKKDITLVFMFLIIFTLWILLAALLPWQITGEKRWAIFSSALLRPSVTENIIVFNDRSEMAGEYSFLSKIGPYPYMSIVFYALALSLTYLIIVFKNNANRTHLWFSKIIKKEV